MPGRWSFFLAVEGFSAHCETDSAVEESLEQMMAAILRMGRHCYPQHPEQLFVLQCGDGFLVASEVHERSLERCATIAVAIMQHLAATGRWARGAIGEGELDDIQDRFPPEVRASLVEDHTYSLHMGLMNISPVMGTALTRTCNLDRIAPTGPLLTIPVPLMSRLGKSVPCERIGDSDIAAIDWVHMQSDLLDRLRLDSALDAASPQTLEQRLDAYGNSHPLPDAWRSNVHDLLHVPMHH